MATLTKKNILKRGFKEVYKDYYKLENSSKEYSYKITLLACGKKQSRPRLFIISIDKVPNISFDNKNPNSWSFSLYKVIGNTKELDELFKLANIC